MGVKFTNNAATTLAAGINNSVTSITVASSSTFPSISGSNYFYATFDDLTNNEVVKVTAISGTTWTVVRAQDDTSARAFSSGDTVELRLNVALLEDALGDAATFARDAFTGTGSATAFTLSQTAASENNLIVFIEGIFQTQSTYSLSGTTLTFSTAPANSREIIVYSTQALSAGTVTTASIVDANITTAKLADDAVTVAKMAVNSIDSDQYVDGSIDTAHIAADAVTAAKLADNAVITANIADDNVTTAKIADDQITLAKMAGLVRGKIIVGDSSGNPAALTVGSNGQVLKSDGTDISWGTDATVAALTSEEVQDIAGAMFTSNTETGITATYQDADGTVDLVVGTLNQNTTGTAATVTGAAQTAITSLGTLTSLAVTNNTTVGGTLGVTGETTLSTHLNMGDSDIIKLGAGADLQIKHDGSDSYIQDTGTGNLLIQFSDLYLSKDAGSTHSMVIRSSGKVGIGTTSPASLLDVGSTSSTGSQITITTNTTSYGGLYFADGADEAYRGAVQYKHGDDFMHFYTAGTERMRITSAGAVLIGQTAQTGYGFAENLVVGGGTGVSNQGITIQSAQNSQGNLAFNRDNGTTAYGRISYQHGTNYMAFMTNNSEKVRINTSGDLLVGTTAYTAGDYGTKIDIYGRIFLSSNATSDGARLIFENPNGTVGEIRTSGSATAYNTSSDYRLKENVVTDWDATTRLKQLKPSRFNFIADDTKTVDGFLAHEVASIVPEAISGEKDAIDEDGNPDYQGIDQSKLVPLLVKTIQELEARITTLEGA